MLEAGKKAPDFEHLIDEQGVIERVMPKVKPDTNAAEILAYLNG